jgi:N-acetylglucosamine-6-sulfatase
MSRRRWACVAALAAVMVVGGCASVVMGEVSGRRDAKAAPAPPNLVFILTDDLSNNLLRYMPNVQALAQRGMTFTNYTVTDSLCCPSRASIFTGEFPHDTKVISNEPPVGGWSRFQATGDEKDTFATRLSGVGYRTALMGKYLNGYTPVSSSGGAYVPPGWSVWGGVGDGYREFDYTMAFNSTTRSFGSAADDYLTRVLGRRAGRYLTSSTSKGTPFLLELATFAPHAPYVPDPLDAGTFTAPAPRDPSFDQVPTNPPTWMQQLTPLTARNERRINTDFDKRVESVQSVDRMLGALETRLQDLGELANTVIVFSSDNGYHMGEHGLRPGKQTAFDTDIHVPLIVAGPGIPAGSTNDDVVENIDLAPTFDELAGVTPPSSTDGHSLVPLLHGQHPSWRTLALVEHHRAPFNKHDPDSQGLAAGNAPSYDAIRSADWTFIRYRASGELEYYDRSTDPYEMHNAIGTLSAARIRSLTADLKALKNCHGASKCWQAGQPNH